MSPIYFQGKPTYIRNRMTLLDRTSFPLLSPVCNKSLHAMLMTFAPVEAILFFIASMLLLLSGKCYLFSPSFIILIHADELIKVLFVMWVLSYCQCWNGLASTLQAVNNVIQVQFFFSEWWNLVAHTPAFRSNAILQDFLLGSYLQEGLKKKKIIGYWLKVQPLLTYYPHLLLFALDKIKYETLFWRYSLMYITCSSCLLLSEIHNHMCDYLSVTRYLNAYVCACMPAYTFMFHVCVCLHVCICAYLYINPLCTCICACIYAWILICMYVCMYVCINLWNLIFG